MQGLRFWGTPQESYSDGIYYWASNESTQNVLGTITLANSDFLAASTFNPVLGSAKTHMFLRNQAVSPVSTISQTDYRWFDDSADSLGTLFTVILVDWYVRTGTIIAYNELSITGLVPQNRMYIKQVLVPNPASGNNISYKNDSHRTVYLEFWNAADTTRLYQLEVPPYSTVQSNSAVNLSNVGFVRVGSYADDIGGYHYGVAKGAPAGNAKVVLRQTPMPVGSGNYAVSGESFSGNNTYYPLYFYTSENALTGGTFG